MEKHLNAKNKIKSLYVSFQTPQTDYMTCPIGYEQVPDFDDMSSFFPCERDDAIQYINLGYEV